MRFIVVFSVLILFISVYSQENTESTVKKSNRYYSNILNDTVNYSVYLHQNYAETDTIPVIYLFYGIGAHENSWLHRDNFRELLDSIIDNTSTPPFIAVMPNAKDSYVINDYQNKYPYRDFFTRELIPAIDSIYQTNCSKKYRAIGGLSMGGYGAIVNCFYHPELFGTCINLSGAIRDDSSIAKVSDKFYEKYLESVYGPRNFSKHWKKNSPFHLINDSLAMELKTINWYNDCGLDDYLLPGNKLFHELLLQYKVPHEFHIRPGTHNWQHWREGIIEGLIFWGENLN